MTVSKLYDTWLKFHPQKDEEREENATVASNHANPVVRSDKPEPDLQNQHVHVQTDGEKERERAILRAERAIVQYVERPFRNRFTPRDLEETLPSGIVALSIEANQEHSSPFSEENLIAAARELLDYVECSAELAETIVDSLLGIILNIALPDVQPTLGGCGSDSKKNVEENWELWKQLRRKRKRGIRM